MNITPINSHLSFRGNNRTITAADGKMLYKTTTYFFRSDLDWDNFASLLEKKYKSTNKVNIINHICSNGQEPYSLVVKLIQKFGESAEKFFPIDARDINFENIASAIRGHLGIKNNDMYRINECTQNKINNFFNFGRAMSQENDLVLIPKKEIKNKVNFKQSDIFDDIDKIPAENTVFMCRNFWPYLKPQSREFLAQKLSQKLTSSSLLAIGDFDYKCQTPKLLRKYGFVETFVENIFTKSNPLL